jgi:enamine deaminase RidA (YjgF/YER057c/UK114 family)
MNNFLFVAATAGLIFPVAAEARNVHITPLNGMVAEAVRVPTGSETIYIAGQLPDPLPGTPARFGDTRAQTISVLTKIQELLKEQGFSLSDVVMMRVVLLGDPTRGGAMDFAGMNEAYAGFFKSLPNKPARFTSQGAGLTVAGALVEIEVQAARAPRAH